MLFTQGSASIKMTILNQTQASPCIRFNKEGTRLAVSTNENGVKILAKADGARTIHAIEGHAQDPSRIASGSVVRVGIK